jgi:hypothetical protein
MKARWVAGNARCGDPEALAAALSLGPAGHLLRRDCAASLGHKLGPPRQQPFTCQLGGARAGHIRPTVFPMKQAGRVWVQGGDELLGAMGALNLGSPGVAPLGPYDLHGVPKPCGQHIRWAAPPSAVTASQSLEGLGCL